VVADDDVVVEVVRGQAEVRTDVAVKGNSRQAIVGEYVVDDDVSRDGSDSAAVGKDANASASARGLVAVPRGGVVGNGVVNNAVVRACWTLRAELGSVRWEHDSAGVGIALEEVSGDEIVVGLAGVVTDEETAELFWETLLAKVDQETPMMCKPSPQSKLSPVR
jgi:hypothetical protein